MKRYQKILWGILIVVILIGGSFVVAYAATGITIMDFFAKEQNLELAEGLLQKDTQKVTVDDYTIALKEVLYESDVKIGYCIFEVTKKGGKPEAPFGAGRSLNGGSFGEDSRFSLSLNASSGNTLEAREEEDKLYIYYSFEASDDLKHPFDHQIILTDTKQKDQNTVSGYREYAFQLKATNNNRKYKIHDSAELSLSPVGIGIRVEDADHFKKQKIVLVDKQGKKDVVVDTEKEVGTAGSSESAIEDRGKRLIQYTYWFKDLLNIQEIEKVIFNGEELDEITDEGKDATSESDAAKANETETDSKNTVELELPSGYSMGEYTEGLGEDDRAIGGWIIYSDKDKNELTDEAINADWNNAGLVFVWDHSKFDFANEDIASMVSGMHAKLISPPEKLSRASGEYICFEVKKDLYTAKGQAGAKEDTSAKLTGVIIDEVYHNQTYAVFLNQKYFDKDEAIAIAEEIKIKE